MFGFNERQRLDALTGLASLALAVALYWASLDVRDFASIGVGAGFVPKLTAALFLLVGLTLIGSAWRSDKPVTAQDKPEPQEDETSGGVGAVALSIALMIGYVAVLDSAGFVLASIVYVFLQILILCKQHRRRYLLFALSAAIPAVLFYYVFVDVFDVSLPPGVLR